MNLRNYAYLGDAVWELFIRKKNVFKTDNSKNLHKITIEMVNTDFQCEMLDKIQDLLTEEEQDIAKRARNLPIPIGRKHIQNKYRKATAFETLIGFWYLENPDYLNKILNVIDKFLQEK